MKKGLLLILFVAVSISASYAQGLIISQYYEGSSFNKWVEVHNPTTDPIDMTGIYVCNFNSSTGSPSACVALGTTFLASDATILVGHNSVALPAYATADVNGACGFNGDDLVVLTTSNTGASSFANRIDEIGVSSDVGGANWGKDISYYRNSDVNMPNTTYTASEWTSASISVVENATATDPFYLGAHVVSPLPITLSSFNAKKQDGEVQLNWATAQEINNDFFTIERSNDARNFTALAKVDGAGNSYYATFYDYTDATPANGVNYYRLMQTDFDGTSTYSEVISVNVKSNGNVFVAPTYVNETATLYFDETIKSDTQYEIFNINGQTVFAGTITMGQQSVNIEASNFVAGQYFVRFNDAQISTLKFVKL